MNKTLVFCAAVTLTGSAFAAGAAETLKATIPADAYDCSTVSVKVAGVDLDASEFTAASNDTGGCALTFKKPPKNYIASVTDANGKVQIFKLVNGKLVNAAAKGPTTDIKAMNP
jgi:hypothetical protein